MNKITSANMSLYFIIFYVILIVIIFILGAVIIRKNCEKEERIIKHDIEIGNVNNDTIQHKYYQNVYTPIE